MQIIVVVDDEKMHLTEWKNALSAYFQVIPANSGKMALRILEEVLPDMIIVDLNMPNMSGFELMEQIHKNPEWSGIPVIISSDKEDIETEKMCFQKGAAEYLYYPFDKEVLLARVRHCMDTQYTRQRLEVEVLRKSLEIERKNAEMERQRSLTEAAMRDSLTGVLNRKDAVKQINSHLLSKSYGAFLILDIDNFKSVNDIYGHIEGDRLLIKFARTLEREAGEDALIARIGGDEFIAFFGHRMLKKELKEIASRIVKKVESEIISPGKLVRVTVSMGIAVAPADGTSFEELYAKADKALYFIKKEGKNAYHIFGDSKKATMGREVTHTTLSDIRKNMGEKIIMNGSYMVDYNSFEKIYRFIERNVKRENRQVQCVLFTLADTKEDIIETDAMKTEMEHLGNAVVQSLRKGDVSSYYSSSQLLVLLLDVDEVNAISVINRIMKQYQNLSEVKDMVLSYEIQKVTGEVSEVTEVV